MNLRLCLDPAAAHCAARPASPWRQALLLASDHCVADAKGSAECHQEPGTHLRTPFCNLTRASVWAAARADRSGSPSSLGSVSSHVGVQRRHEQVLW